MKLIGKKKVAIILSVINILSDNSHFHLHISAFDGETKGSNLLLYVERLFLLDEKNYDKIK